MPRLPEPAHSIAPFPPVHYDFDVGQGVWRVRWVSEDFYSCSLDEARAHAIVRLPVELAVERITVEPHVDKLLGELAGDKDQQSEGAEDLRRQVCRYVQEREIPLGVGDLAALLGVDRATVHAELQATAS